MGCGIGWGGVGCGIGVGHTDKSSEATQRREALYIWIGFLAEFEKEKRR